MTSRRRLGSPVAGEEVEWVRENLGDLCLEEPEAVSASSRWTGTQAAADAALAALDPSGYAARRSRVAPMSQRGATGLSPYIRHGLLTLQRVWSAMAGRRGRDVEMLRNELHWQEYARHLYARVGSDLARPLRAEPVGGPEPEPGVSIDPDSVWDRSMVCVAENLSELERDGWVVNQARMWLASQWTVRVGAPISSGEDHFFRHLLAGSRAANRSGWQWTAGTATGRRYGFSRSQVERQAPGWCQRCEHRTCCPIEDPIPDTPVMWRQEPTGLRRISDLEGAMGPRRTWRSDTREPDVVWITAESLGDEDPALSSHLDSPVVFVFDDALLSRLGLSGKRLVFLVQRLAELSSSRELEIWRGDPREVLGSRRAAVTFAPVPGFRRHMAQVSVGVLHPWPWLVKPGPGSVASFSAWRSSHGIAPRR